MDTIVKLKAKGYEVITDRQVFCDELSCGRAVQAFDENGLHFSIRLEGENIVFGMVKPFSMDKTVYLKKVKPSVVHKRIVPPKLKVVCNNGEVGTVNATLGMQTEYGILVRYAGKTTWVVSPRGYLRRFRGGIDNMPLVDIYQVKPEQVEFHAHQEICA